MQSEVGSRVLMLAPTRRDGTITCEILGQVGLTCEVCNNVHEVVVNLQAGAGALILSDDCFNDPGISELFEVLGAQPNWSDIPSIILTKDSTDGLKNNRALKSLTNMTVIQRPAPMRSLVTAAQTAVRARNRQYEIRDQLNLIEQAAAEFQLMVDAIPQLAWMAHANGNIFWYNHRWLEYTGVKLEEVDGLDWEKVHDPGYLPIVKEKWTKSLAEGIPFEMERPGPQCA